MKTQFGFRKLGAFVMGAYLLAAFVFVATQTVWTPMAEARSWKAEFLKVTSWKGDTITFEVRFFAPGSGLDDLYEPSPSCYVDDIDIKMVATDSNTNEVFIDETWNCAVCGRISVMQIVPLQYTSDKLNGHKKVKFTGTVTRINYH